MKSKEIKKKELESKIRSVQLKGGKVRTDQEWEVSWTRRGLLTIMTYVAMWVYLSVIGVRRSWLMAVAPSMAFMLSTMTLPWFKRLWSKYIRK